jgi:transposase
MGFAGIDVGKDSLTVCDRSTGEVWSVAQTVAERRKLVAELRRRGIQRVALESTGGYERPIADALAVAEVHVMRLNPRQARDLARGFAVLAKTDAVDAAVLALIAEKLEHPAWKPPTAAEDERRALVERRIELVEARTSELNRLGSSTIAAVQRSLRRQLRTLEKEIERIETLLRERVQADEALRQDVATLDQTKGVGWTTAVTLRVLLPELGTVGRTRISALVGVAPFACDSGKHRGERHIRGGRAAVRSALYMATLSAVGYDPPMSATYRRLIAKGKPSKVAMTACMRKLLIRLNARLRDARTATPRGVTTAA